MTTAIFLIMATIEDMVSHEIAFREASSDANMLVFPSQLTKENPDLPEPEGKDLRVDFQGPVLNIYATLVVRLARSSLFRLKQMWRNAVLFTSHGGGEYGLFLSQRGDGAGSVTLFYERALSETRQGFEDYVVSHIKRRARAESVESQRPLLCVNADCRAPFPEVAVTRRKAGGFSSVLCSACETRTLLPGAVLEPSGVPTQAVAQIDSDADATRDFEVGLLSASGEMLTKRFRKWTGATRATLALVFTDLVGSTRLGEQLGDEEMFRVRSVHFANARMLIARFRGYEVKTIGDAFMVAFRTSVEALNFCLALKREPGDKRLSVRAGIHVGPVRIDDEDLFGRMVNFAARVVSAIKGAEIWLSDRAYDDIKSERAMAHRRLSWEEHARLDLKGFDGYYTLWQIKD
jgi:class 3 adenylate cyclase